VAYKILQRLAQVLLAKVVIIKLIQSYQKMRILVANSSYSFIKYAIQTTTKIARILKRFAHSTQEGINP